MIVVRHGQRRKDDCHRRRNDPWMTLGAFPRDLTPRGVARQSVGLSELFRVASGATRSRWNVVAEGKTVTRFADAGISASRHTQCETSRLFGVA
jgi:hypothetical protein